MEHPEILPLIVIVVGILLSSLKKRKVPSTPPMPPRQPRFPQKPIDPVVIPGNMKTSDAELPPIPKQKKKNRKKAKMPQRPFFIENPIDEGKRSTVSPIFNNDITLSEPHPAVPTDNEEWRRAIVAHEILKRKF